MVYQLMAYGRFTLSNRIITTFSVKSFQCLQHSNIFGIGFHLAVSQSPVASIITSKYNIGKN